MFGEGRTIAAGLVFALALQVSAMAGGGEPQEKAYNTALENPYDDAALQAYIDKLPKVDAPLGQDGKLYIVEGDMPMTLKQVRAYLFSKSAAPAPAGGQQPELIVHVYRGQPAYWRRSDGRKLRYAVVRATFPDDATYKQVIADMNSATVSWEEVCPACGVDFQHAREHDDITTMEEFGQLAQSDKVRFIVIYQNAGGQFIAAAFFPSDPWNRRILAVDPSYFNLSGGYTGVGVLRHELGHVLGYRHEHTRGVPGCYFEDNSWLPLSPYDPHSVMHYFCGGAGTEHLRLSEIDKEGHRAQYGP